MSRWDRIRQAVWADTLTRRLFLLLWATLMLSHVLGFSMAHMGSERPPHHWRGVPLVPEMPPVPGMFPAPPGEPRLTSASGPTYRVGFPGTPPPLGPHVMPPRLWLDYLVRVLVMAAAAWLGARWLSRPVRRLTEASVALSEALGRHVAIPELNERSGPVEVRQAAQVFNRMARQLSERFEERGLLMASISHDLRTPLTRLRMRLERLRPDPIAERCVADVNDVNALIDAVLDALNDERTQEPRQELDVTALVEAMADDRAEEGQPVQAEVGPQPGMGAVARAQPVALKRVLDNLVDNALRHGERARLAVHAEGEWVQIRVDDDGPGIPVGQLEAVFKPFYRLDGSRSQDTGGVGLGLYIARELTQRQGGTLTLMNRPEGGLRAVLTLPRAAG